jgi:glyoxylase-like metal-dependent hydrolase (beta-lactamase superfamily II)
MTEPDEVAEAGEPVVDGVWHWRIRNHAIGGAFSSSQAVAGADGEMVLIDPVRLAPEAMAALPLPTAICLTAKCHQRAAWRYRLDFAAAVWAPEGTVPMDGEPDHRYADGDMLPGGLRAVHTPGPEPVHYSFLLERGPGVFFCSDLLGNDPMRGLDFVPPEFHDDPAETRRSVERMLDLPFGVLCLDHGPPVVDDPKAAIRALLRRAP